MPYHIRVAVVVEVWAFPSSKWLAVGVHRGALCTTVGKRWSFPRREGKE